MLSPTANSTQEINYEHIGLTDNPGYRLLLIFRGYRKPGGYLKYSAGSYWYTDHKQQGNRPEVVHAYDAGNIE